MVDWKPNPILLSETRKILECLAAEILESGLQENEPDILEESTRVENRTVMQLLEAAGTLAFLLAGKTATECLSAAREELLRSAEEALNGFGPEIIDEAGHEILAMARDLALAGDEERLEMEERIVGALGVRDRFELALEGARLILGREPDLDDELLASIVAFDDLLRTQLWRLLPLGGRRAAKCLWVAPSLRYRLWWWHQGCELPETALEHLGTTARVLHLFPEAREELEQLIRAENAIEDFVRGKPDPSADVSIRDHLMEKSRSSRRASDLHEGLSLAAADLEETVILKTREVVFSTNGSELIVDVESPAESRPDAPPVLEAEGLEPLVGRATERGRFVFSLSNPQFAGREAKLRVYLKQGERAFTFSPGPKA